MRHVCDRDLRILVYAPHTRRLLVEVGVDARISKAERFVAALKRAAASACRHFSPTDRRVESMIAEEAERLLVVVERAFVHENGGRHVGGGHK